MHKKLVLILISSSFCLTFNTSCNNKSSLNNEVIFSELYVGSNVFDTVLEVSVLKENVDLSNYKINFYGSGININYTYSFSELDCDKTNNVILFLNKSSTYVTTSSNVITLDGDYICGYYYVELTNNNEVVDALGTKGFTLEYARSGSLVRLKEYYESRSSYNELDYIEVRSGITTYLGNNEAPITLESLLEGPKVSEEYKNITNFVDGEFGTGALVDVSVISLGDGDTTHFSFPSDSGVSSSYDNRVRYLLIDTPEIDHGSGGVSAEPFGEEAKTFNNTRLTNATKIMCQSNKNKPITETYGRTLAYVWYTTKENPTIDDLSLLNFELVKAGLAKFSTYDIYEDMYYGDIYYYDYFNYAANLAKSQKIKIYGEIDPTFNY